MSSISSQFEAISFVYINYVPNLLNSETIPVALATPNFYDNQLNNAAKTNFRDLFVIVAIKLPRTGILLTNCANYVLMNLC